MTQANQRPTPQQLNALLEQLMHELMACYPNAVLLFGSTVAYLEDPDANPAPNDLDILLVTSNPLLDVSFEGFDPPVELHRFRIDEAIAIARSLRYESKAVALSKLYTKNVTKQHARDVILASILLGTSYNDFGIEQIDVGGRIDTRDYSRHLVLYGHDWWQALTAWARQRRSFFQRLADKAVMADQFQ